MMMTISLFGWNGENCPYTEFERSRNETNSHFLIVSSEALTELYEVKTFGIYKGFQFQVFDHSSDPGKLFIGIKNAVALDQLQLYGDENWSFTDIDREFMGAMWEIRTPVMNRSMPKEVAFEVKPKNQ